jgi:Fic family protein
MASDRPRAKRPRPKPFPAWPAIGYETLPWLSEVPRGTASRRDIRRHRGPYQAAVPARICQLSPQLPAEVTAAAEEASNEIARFDAEMGGEIAPFHAVLLRSESAASSRIENLTASARAIAEAELGDIGRRNASEIVANTHAMNAAIALADRIDAEAILAMHAALMEHTAPDIAGQWRRQQVWIGGGDLGPHRALFVPPRHSRVTRAVADLVRFVARDDLPTLAQAAIAHAQFETIHPFPDGNGRTGRALLHAMLRTKGLTRTVTVPVSAGLLTNPQTYFDALTAYRDGDPTAIVVRVAEAAFAAIANGRRLVSDLRAIRHGWNGRIAARRDSAAWRVADLLLHYPVINVALLARELGISANNAPRYIQPLEKAAVLVECTDRKRNRVWRAPDVLQAIDAFATRAGRRRPD